MEKLLRQQQEAKETAGVCIAPSLIAAKTTFSLMLSAYLAKGEDDEKQVDAQLRQRTAYLRRALEALQYLKASGTWLRTIEPFI